MRAERPRVSVARPLGPADVDSAAKLAALEGAALWDAAAFAHELTLAHATLVAVDGDDGTLAAFAVWWRVVDETHLLNMVVAPGARRRGLGAALVAQMLDEARGRGDVAALLEVRAGNRAAQALYERAGFSRAGLRRGYYADGEDAVQMVRSL